MSAMRLTSLPRYLRSIWRRELKPAGWTIEDGGGHLHLAHPSGARVSCSRTPRNEDVAASNVRQDVRRALRRTQR